MSVAGREHSASLGARVTQRETKSGSRDQLRTKFSAAAILNSIAGVIQALLVDMLKLM